MRINSTSIHQATYSPLQDVICAARSQQTTASTLSSAGATEKKGVIRTIFSSIGSALSTIWQWVKWILCCCPRAPKGIELLKADPKKAAEIIRKDPIPVVKSIMDDLFANPEALIKTFGTHGNNIEDIWDSLDPETKGKLIKDPVFIVNIAQFLTNQPLLDKTLVPQLTNIRDKYIKGIAQGVQNASATLNLQLANLPPSAEKALMQTAFGEVLPALCNPDAWLALFFLKSEERLELVDNVKELFGLKIAQRGIEAQIEEAKRQNTPIPDRIKTVLDKIEDEYDTKLDALRDSDAFDKTVGKMLDLDDDLFDKIINIAMNLPRLTPYVQQFTQSSQFDLPKIITALTYGQLETAKEMQQFVGDRVPLLQMILEKYVQLLEKPEQMELLVKTLLNNAMKFAEESVSGQIALPVGPLAPAHMSAAPSLRGSSMPGTPSRVSAYGGAVGMPGLPPYSNPYSKMVSFEEGDKALFDLLAKHSDAIADGEEEMGVPIRFEPDDEGSGRDEDVVIEAFSDEE